MDRTAGILLHPTSIPCPYPIGDLGPGARRYLDFLVAAGASWWQILPLCPPGPGFSPYSGASTFAGNPALVSPEVLVEEGLLEPGEIEAPPPVTGPVDYAAALHWKGRLLRRAWERFAAGTSAELETDLAEFARDDHWWLDDYCLYVALKEAHGGRGWIEWPRDLRLREPAALARTRTDLRDEVAYHRFCQFLFFRQWRALREAAAQRGLRILGDLPIFVAYDSADVWAQKELFKLDAEGHPDVVAGVPPDYFSATGQLWGNPLYDWDRHAADGFSWWIARTLHTLDLVDAVRLDHFRGFAAAWEVPAGDATAEGGLWAPGPGRALFDALQLAIGSLPLVAEDLGEITPDVVELRRRLGLPGMAILHFAFEPEPRSTFIPYRLRPDTVIYTGTHDNNTSVGWYTEDASEAEKDLVRRYTASDGSDINWDLIRLAMASVADLAVIPHQDLVGLGTEGRMNRPGQAEGNWRFRLTEAMLDPSLAARLREMVETYGRLPRGEGPR